VQTASRICPLAVQYNISAAQGLKKTKDIEHYAEIELIAINIAKTPVIFNVISNTSYYFILYNIEIILRTQTYKINQEHSLPESIKVLQTQRNWYCFIPRTERIRDVMTTSYLMLPESNEKVNMTLCRYYCYGF
jgi:heme/copper-type cytochrome/quinol oxidase subunit 2